MSEDMIDLGRMEQECAVTEKSSAKKKVKIYPSLWLQDIELPLSPTDVGKTFNITGIVRVTGIEERVRENQKRKKEYNFELHKIKIHNARGKLRQALIKAGR